MLMQGKLGGTGKMIILPVDQGFEHGPRAASPPTPPPMTRITTTSWPSTPG
jgi:DhnA family fructose-bisphosphate aldolase class Ia